MEPFLGQIQPFGFNFPPRGWLLCDGQLLAISSNTALFSLYGTTYGGDGRTTFGIPELRGRSIVHVGSGPGLDTITWGERGGSYQMTISVPHMPSHNHGFRGISGDATGNSGSNAYLSTGGRGSTTADIFNTGTTSNDSLNNGSIQNTGGGQPLNIRNPFLGIYVSCATVGVYPSRS